MVGRDFKGLYEKYSKARRRDTRTKPGILDKINEILTKPSDFFDSVKYEEGIKGVFKFFTILSLVNLSVGLVDYFLTSFGFLPFSLFSFFPFGGMANIPFGQDAIASLGILGFIIPMANYAVGLIGSFIGAAIVYFLIMLLKGTTDFKATYRIIAYAMTPTLLLGWVPFAGFFISLYSIYLGTRGVSKICGMPMLRSFIAVFLIPAMLAMSISIVAGGFSGILNLGVSSKQPCRPCFKRTDIEYTYHNDETLFVTIGPKSIIYNDIGYLAGEPLEIAILDCTWERNKCEVTVDYTIIETGEQVIEKVTLHTLHKDS